jgi:ABC-type multidrug transport system fused ATPase/permease subunit
MNILFMTVVTSGLLEGIGISAIIPLLSIAAGEETKTGYASAFSNFLEKIGLGTSLGSVLVFMIILFFLKGVFTALNIGIAAEIKTKLEKSLRTTFCHKYTAVTYRYFITKPVGYYNNLISNEIANTIAALNNYINVIVTVIYIIVYITGAFLMNPQLTALVLCASFILFFLLRKIPRVLQEISVSLTGIRATTQSLIIQKLYNYKYLKATHCFGPVLDKIEAQIEENRRGEFKNEVYNGIPYSFMEVLTVISLALLVWYYVGLKNKEISEIFVLLVFFWRALGRTLSLQSAWQRFSTYVGSVKNVNDENEAMEKNYEHRGAKVVKRFSNAIQLRNVEFAYGDTPVLRDINMVIPKNKSIGIIGHSGAGKTTLFDIIVGLIKPQNGSIEIDGIDYKEIDIYSLRDMVGYVTQDPITFNDTISNNISMWDSTIDQKTIDEKIRKAVESANCDEFIGFTDDGMNTVLGDKGVKLSGGQRQRIAIAREIYKDPEIMIFDEATSALDSASEQFIQDSINLMKGNRTLILIAHRLSTIRNCDHIYVLSAGKVVEEGSFISLFKNEASFFRQMCLSQQVGL